MFPICLVFVLAFQKIYACRNAADRLKNDPLCVECDVKSEITTYGTYLEFLVKLRAHIPLLIVKSHGVYTGWHVQTIKRRMHHGAKKRLV